MDVKLVVDCSKPLGRQEKYRPLTKRELAQRRRDERECAQRNRANAYMHLRVIRDALLRLTDHYAGEPAWDRWRQKLRDLPETVKDPEKPRWPKPPQAVSCLAAYRSLWPRLDWTPLTKGTH